MPSCKFPLTLGAKMVKTIASLLEGDNKMEKLFEFECPQYGERFTSPYLAAACLNHSAPGPARRIDNSTAVPFGADSNRLGLNIFAYS